MTPEQLSSMQEWMEEAEKAQLGFRLQVVWYAEDQELVFSPRMSPGVRLGLRVVDVNHVHSRSDIFAKALSEARELGLLPAKEEMTTNTAAAPIMTKDSAMEVLRRYFQAEGAILARNWIADDLRRRAGTEYAYGHDSEAIMIRRLASEVFSSRVEECPDIEKPPEEETVQALEVLSRLKRGAIPNA